MGWEETGVEGRGREGGGEGEGKEGKGRRTDSEVMTTTVLLRECLAQLLVCVHALPCSSGQKSVSDSVAAGDGDHQPWQSGGHLGTHHKAPH